MNRRHVNAAITAGLALTMTVGSVPPQAFAEMMQGDACREGVLEWVPKEKVTQLPIWEGDKIFFRLLNEERPWFSLKLVYEGDTLRQAVLDGKRVV